MSEITDSDGVWILVNKETDSETSSVVAVCETELQSESFSESEEDELWKNDWCNQDEIISDSDIEACVEEKESDIKNDLCNEIPADSLTQCFEEKCEDAASGESKQGAGTQAIEENEDNHGHMINEKKSQSEYAKCMGTDSSQEEENDGRDEKILSTVSSASDFERIALSDTQSLSSAGRCDMEEESSVTVSGPSNSASLEETFVLKDSACQTSKVNEDMIETSVQAVASCTDAYTEPEVDRTGEKNEPVTFLHRQKFVLPLIVIGVGFVLGRCSVPHSRIGTNYAFNSVDKKLVSMANEPLVNTASPSVAAPHSKDVPVIPCAANQDMLCPSLKMRIDKEFERQKTHVEMLQKQLQNSRSEYSMRIETLEKELRSKELSWANLKLVHKNTVENLKANEKQLTEKYNGMKLRVQRYRSESRRLINGISGCRRQSRYLQSIGERSSRLNALRDVSSLSPLIHALRNEVETCQNIDRVKCETTLMRPDSMLQDSTIQSSKFDRERKSLAVQALYQSIADERTIAIAVNGSYHQMGESLWHPYVQLAVMRSRMEKDLKAKNREYHRLEVSYLAANQSLEIMERQKANLKRRLTAAKVEIKLLRLEKIGLAKQLRNVTMELKQKSSWQYCVKSAITNELEKLNDTRLYETANKVAEKVTKTSKKAWSKLRKLAQKLYQSEDDVHNSDRHSVAQYETSYQNFKHEQKGKFTDYKKQHKGMKSRKHASWSKLHHADDENHGGSNSRKTGSSKDDDHYSGDRPHQKTEKLSDTEEEDDTSFETIVSDHVTAAKEAGEAVMHHLTPIYQKCEKVYHEVKEKIAQKSFQEVWDSVVESTKTTVGEDQKDGRLSWVWDSYNNFTKSIQPAIAHVIPYSWGFSENNQDNPDTKEKESTGNVEETSGNKVSVNPQWFLHMFKERETLRRENAADSPPLSEEEFDWFLQMFAERERLRHSDDYEDNYLDYDDINDKEMDWYLKMFESRAQLRFQNEEDNRNWYMKMSAARSKARLEQRKKASSQWYTDMFEARKSLREKTKKDNWPGSKTTKKTGKINL